MTLLIVNKSFTNFYKWEASEGRNFRVAIRVLLLIILYYGSNAAINVGKSSITVF